MGTIDVEGKKLALSSKDVETLATDAGCTMEIVKDKVFNFEDEDVVSEDGDEFEDQPICYSPKSKEERMRLEYIKLTVNSDRDPLSHPGSQSRLQKLLVGDEEVRRDLSKQKSDTLDLRESSSNLYKRYERLGNYEEIIANKDNKFEELSSGRVLKRRIMSGTGRQVDENSLVFYNCALWAENTSEPFDSTWLRGKTFTVEIAKDSVIPGLQELILTTKKGEWCEAFIRPEAAFGQLGILPRVPPNATIFCLLEVVKVIQADKISILSLNPSKAQENGITFQDLLEASDEARMRGNYFYNQKQYHVALQRYKSGIRILEDLTYKDENEEKKAMLLLIKLYNNSAKSATALGDPRLALAACKQASMIDDMDPKTHWNKLKAWKKKGHFDRALGVSRRAMQLFSDPKVLNLFRREADDLKKRIQNERLELDELHRLMGKAILA